MNSMRYSDAEELAGNLNLSIIHHRVELSKVTVPSIMISLNVNVSRSLQSKSKTVVSIKVEANFVIWEGRESKL